VLTLTGMLEASVGEHPDHLAIVDGDRTVSYAQLLGRSARLARDLASRGFARGDRLVNWLPNSDAWLILMFAAARLGLVSPLLNTRYRASELGDVLRMTNPRGLALNQGFHGIDFEEILGETGIAVEHVLRPETISQPSAAPARAEGAPEDVAILFTTSGTTASPKLAGHDQQGVTLHAANLARAIEIGPGDIMLIALPLCGAFGFVGAMAAMYSGARLVLQSVFEPSETLALMDQHQVTHFYGSDAMLRAVMEAAGGACRAFASWRWGCHANFSGQPLQLVRDLERVGVRIHGTYGSSEGFALMSRWPAGAPAEERAHAGGHLISREIQVRVRDPESGEEVPTGQPGELQFRGYNVTTGYFGNQAATEAAFTPDGWYRSGDLGYLLPSGAFIFLSRLKDSMRVRGYLVDPLEIEEQLERHAAVELAQVVGVTAPGEGEVPVAFVKLRPGESASAEQLARYCEERLASYKVPGLVRFVEEFPFVDGPNGRKIQKLKLREVAAAEMGVSTN
jgi:fatty-acyl-CoA synthase